MRVVNASPQLIKTVGEKANIFEIFTWYISSLQGVSQIHSLPQGKDNPTLLKYELRTTGF